MSRFGAGLALVAGLAVPHLCQAQDQDRAPDMWFDVPRQDLSVALRTLAEQSHTQLLFSSDQVDGRFSHNVHGRLAPPMAFEQALRQTGLTVRRVAPNTFVVLPAAPEPPVVATVPVAIRDTIRPIEVVVLGRRPSLTRAAYGDDPPAGESFVTLSRLDRETLLRRPAGNALDSLSLVSGVTLLNTGRSFIGGVDGASRGESLYLASRGLDAEYSLNLFDGVAIAQGMPYSRAVQMSLLPPQGLQNVTVYKSASADMAGDVLGATIDWRTPTAFDFASSGAVRLEVSGSQGSRAHDYGGDGTGGGASLEMARRFGAGQALGVYVNLFADHRAFANSEIGGIMAAQNDKTWAFQLAASPQGDNPSTIRPDSNLTLTGLNFGLSEGATDRAVAVVNLDWRPAGLVSAFLHLAAGQARTEQNSTLEEVIPGQTTWRADGSGLYRASVDRVSTRVWYETNPETISLLNFKTGFTWRGETLTLSPSAFASYSRFARPRHLEASIRVDQNDGYNTGNMMRTLGGAAIAYDRLGRPVPVLTPDIRADLDQAGDRLLARRAGQLTAQSSGLLRYGAAIDAVWTPAGNGALHRLDLGARYTASDRETSERDWRNGYLADLTQTSGLTWSRLGVTTGTYPQAAPGLYDWRLPRVDGKALLDIFHRFETAASFDTCGAIYANNYNCNSQTGYENVAAAYAAAHIALGPVEIVPGWRQEWTAIRNTYWVMPLADGIEQTGFWQHNATRYSEGLPSLFATWRTSEGPVVRFGLWRAYARPAFTQLAGSAKTTTVAGVTTIESGNPDLKPVTAVNADLSVTWESAGSRRVMIGAYTKSLKNFLYDAGGGPTNPTQPKTGNVRYVYPQNAGAGTISGLEMEGSLRLSDEVTANMAVARQWTHVDLGSDLGHDKPMPNAPGLVGSVSLTYRGQALSAGITWRYTSAYLTTYDVLDLKATWDDQWVRPAGHVDLEGAWKITPRITLRASADNVLGSSFYWSHVGKHSLAISDIVDSGRTYRLSAVYAF